MNTLILSAAARLTGAGCVLADGGGFIHCNPTRVITNNTGVVFGPFTLLSRRGLVRVGRCLAGVELAQYTGSVVRVCQPRIYVSSVTFQHTFVCGAGKTMIYTPSVVRELFLVRKAHQLFSEHQRVL